MKTVLSTGFKNVIVLAQKFNITAAQLSLLNKGLNFIPIIRGEKNVKNQTQIDIRTYHRRLKLAAHFEHTRETSPLPFMPKSTWVPPEPTVPWPLRQLIQSDVEWFDNHYVAKCNTTNLDQFELEALKQLKSNKNIVIKPADKGSSVVVLDREQYLWEGYRQLNDKKYYKSLKKPIFKDTIPLVTEILQKLQTKKFINAKQRSFLMGDAEPRPRLFYMLPKIHKARDKWSLPNVIPPGRPIVSDCGSETYATAHFVETYLNPISIKHPSYIKDTYDFVNKIKLLHIPADAFLFTMDVDSLYTNINTDQGMEAVKNTFQLYPDSKRPDKEILQLLYLNLTRNDFEFDDKYFLQISGTAMGKKFAPSFANIFMAQWEQSALSQAPIKPLHYYRYLDDIWGVWTHSLQEFDTFCNFLNNFNSSITIKSTHSLTEVDFLDTTTFKGPNFQQTNRLDIKVFFKATDTHALLNKSSHHPKHTFAGLVKSQFLRFHRICTRIEDFGFAVRVLCKVLSTRGYSWSFLRQVYSTFKTVKPINVDPMIPLVIFYSESATKLARAFKNNFKILQEQGGLLVDHRIITAYKKNNNIQDILIKAKLTPLTQKTEAARTEFYKFEPWAYNKHTNQVFATQKSTNTKTKNCIYLISCLTCSMQYVGETGNTLLTRFTQHRYNISRKKDTHLPLVSHFIEHGWNNLTTTILEANPNWSKKQRKYLERQWIHKLNTRLPFGLNEK